MFVRFIFFLACFFLHWDFHMNCFGIRQQIIMDLYSYILYVIKYCAFYIIYNLSRIENLAKFAVPLHHKTVYTKQENIFRFCLIY